LENVEEEIKIKWGSNIKINVPERRHGVVD
jgi:hypothetical protein